MDTFQAIFVQPWPFWIAGIAIGAFVPLFAWATGKALGISSGYAEMCSLGAPPGSDRWKLWFVIGLPIGGFAASELAGARGFELDVPMLASALGLGRAAVLALLALGGVLVGLGARTAGGCTSGHSIVGIALGAKSSLVATIGFMIGGFVTAQLLFRVLGGAA
jgi:uncharacterized membrane protein YedE/YeeE